MPRFNVVWRHPTGTWGVALIRIMPTKDGFELLKQLHEQYSINDNDKSNRVVSFIGTTSFVLAGYGFAVWEFLTNKNILKDSDNLIYWISLAACLVLTLLAFLCVNFGYSSRRDQFIIYRIRKDILGKEYDKYFRGQYDPCGKNPLNFLVGYYFIIFLFLNIAIVGIYKNSCSIDESNKCYYCCFCFSNIVANFAFLLYYYCCKYLRLSFEEKNDVINQ